MRCLRQNASAFTPARDSGGAAGGAPSQPVRRELGAASGPAGGEQGAEVPVGGAERSGRGGQGAEGPDRARGWLRGRAPGGFGQGRASARGRPALCGQLERSPAPLVPAAGVGGSGRRNYRKKRYLCSAGQLPILSVRSRSRGGRGPCYNKRS